VIEPNCSMEVPVVFKPSKIGDDHEGEVTFTSKEVIACVVYNIIQPGYLIARSTSVQDER